MLGCACTSRNRGIAQYVQIIGGFIFMKKFAFTTLAAAVVAGFSFTNQAEAETDQQIEVKGPYVYTVSGECLPISDFINKNKDDNGQIDWSEVNFDDFDYGDWIPDSEEVPEQEEAQTSEEEVVEEDPETSEETPQLEEVDSEEDQVDTESTADVSADEEQMVQLVNQERQEAGLEPLTIDPELTEVARVKAQDMIDNNYFDHNSPTFGSPFEMMDQFGVSYNTAGENLAGNQTVEAAHTALMNSQGHRENILSGNYTEVGIGVVDGGPYGKMFVQLFKG